MALDEFNFLLADSFVMGVQYGNRTGLCDLITPLPTEQALVAMAQFGKENHATSDMYDSRAL